MQTLLVIASLWANAEPAAAKQPIGPWLTTQAGSLSRRATELQLQLDKWAASNQDCVFDIRVISLADEAAAEIRFQANLPERRSTSPIILKREQAQTVQRILPHILAAGHARDEAQHSVETAIGKAAIASHYVKTPVIYVDANGVARTGLTMRQQGDQFQLTTRRISFATTEFGVVITPDRGATPVARAPEPAIPNFQRVNVGIGESLVLFRDAVPVATPPVGARVVQAAALEPEIEPPRATLFIVTPRRGPKLSPPPPDLFKRL